MILPSLVGQLSIKNKRMQVVKFEPNWAQLRYLEIAEHQLNTSGRIRIIVLKARQLGISTVTEALAFSLAWVFPGYRVTVLAHEIPASQNLLEMTHRYWETYPYSRLYTPKYLSKNDIGWKETGSALKVATAGNRGAGRSSTTHFLHASEVGFYTDPKTVMLGMTQTIAEEFGSAVVLESTANGRGNYFHEEWLKAEQGETEFAPLFLPWWEHYEYRASYLGITYKLGTLDDEEKTLRRMGLDDDQLAWRRWMIANKCGGDVLMFMQEYPATPEEAFLATGLNVFPGEHLRACYKPESGVRGMLIRDGDRVEFKAASDGPLTLFRKPVDDLDWGQYMVAGDPTRTVKGDPACAQVLNRRTMEQVAVWRGRIDPVQFGEELFKLGMFFNEATVTTEITGPGFGTIGRLVGMNYPKVWQRQVRADKTPGEIMQDTYGWATTIQTKQLSISWLIRHVIDHSLAIHDRKTYDEMSNYVTLEGGGYGNGNGEEHDDTVMSMAVGVTCHVMDTPLAAYGAETAGMTDEFVSAANEWEYN